MEPVGLAKKEAFLGELKKEKEELQRKRKTVTDSTELEKIDKRISLIDNLLNPIDSDSMLLPEYRKNGYFNSAEFKEIEAEVDARLQQIENLDRKNIEEVKQKLLKELYHIDWKPTYERYMPGTLVMRD